jgi:hypothetical protein
MRLRHIAVLLLLLFAGVFAAPASAQDYDRYLIPVTGGNIAGANGSLWTTELTVHNPRDGEVGILADVCSVVFLTPPCQNIAFIPQQTSRRIAITRASYSQGAFIYVPRNLNYGPTPMTLRARDLSKTAESFGTEVPIARDSDFAQLVIITDVPTDARYRATLRVYNSSEAPRVVTMRVYTLAGREPIETRSIELAGVNILVFDPTPFHPGYAEIDPLTPLVRASGERVRIEVEDPIRHIVSPPPPPIWALVSITNNDTQQVTTITPHP